MSFSTKSFAFLKEELWTLCSLKFGYFEGLGAEILTALWLILDIVELGTSQEKDFEWIENLY